MKAYSDATLTELLPVHVVISKDKQLLQNKRKLNDKTFLKIIEYRRFFCTNPNGLSYAKRCSKNVFSLFAQLTWPTKHLTLNGLLFIIIVIFSIFSSCAYSNLLSKIHYYELNLSMHNQESDYLVSYLNSSKVFQNFMTPLPVCRHQIGLRKTERQRTGKLRFTTKWCNLNKVRQSKIKIT